MGAGTALKPMTVIVSGQDQGQPFPEKNLPGFVNLSLAPFVYKMSATEMPSSDDKSRPPADEVEGMMARSHANFCGNRTSTTTQADCRRSTLAVYPLRQ